MFHFRNPLIHYYEPNKTIMVATSIMLRCSYCNKTFKYTGAEFSGTLYIVLGALCEKCLNKIRKNNPAILRMVEEMERNPEKYKDRL